MNIVVKYSMLRIGIFVAVLAILWAFGVRGWIPIVIAAVVAMALSYIFLRGLRDQMVEHLIERRARKGAQRTPASDEDTRFEDAVDELERGPERPGPAG